MAMTSFSHARVSSSVSNVRTGVEPGGDLEHAHSDDELKLLIATATPGTVREGLGRSIVLNAFDLSQRLAREVMRPRQEIVGLDTDADIESCFEVARRTRFSRFPLCEGGDLDRTLGVVHIKDLHASEQQARTGRDLAPAAGRARRIIRLFRDWNDRHGGN